MKATMRFLLPTVLLLSLVSTFSASTFSANAQATRPEPTGRQYEIIRTVQSVDGYIDHDLHKEFWELMPPELLSRSLNRHKFEEMLAEVGSERSSFLVESWRSAEESLRARRIVRGTGYIAAREAVLKASNNPAYQFKVRESIQSAEQLLKAAAEGIPIDTPGGKVFITSDLIERVLSGLEASEFRIRKLMSPVWDGGVVEFRYPEAHVSVLAITPFVLERKQLTTSAKRQAQMVVLNRRVNSTSYQMIAYSGVDGDFLDPSNSVISIAKAGIRGAGTTETTHVVASDWRGRTSATGLGSAKTSEGQVFVAVRVVAVPELKGIIQFMTVTETSGAEAISMRGSLEDSSSVLTR